MQMLCPSHSRLWLTWASRGTQPLPLCASQTAMSRLPCRSSSDKITLRSQAVHVMIFTGHFLAMGVDMGLPGLIQQQIPTHQGVSGSSKPCSIIVLHLNLDHKPVDVDALRVSDRKEWHFTAGRGGLAGTEIKLNGATLKWVLGKPVPAMPPPARSCTLRRRASSSCADFETAHTVGLYDLLHMS